LLTDLGLDFNREKLYQSGFEFRSFDEFPATYLPAVLHTIVLICEHSKAFDQVEWATDSIAWNNLVFRALKEGYKTEISEEEKLEILKALQLADARENQLSKEWTPYNHLDQFFFAILQHLHELHQKDTLYLNSLMGETPSNAPHWDNFNLHQQEQHLKQLATV